MKLGNDAEDQGSNGRAFLGIPKVYTTVTSEPLEDIMHGSHNFFDAVTTSGDKAKGAAIDGAPNLISGAILMLSLSEVGKLLWRE